MEIFVLYLLIINILAFLMMFIDKRQAIKRGWRISELSLIMVSVIGGGAGLYLGMYIFRHKTKKIKFYLGIPFILLIQIVFIYFVNK